MKIILFTLLLSCATVFASRSPAIDPVSGISIEEYNETNPETSRGFNFAKDDSSYSSRSSDANLTLSTALFLIFASSMPFIVWFGVMHSLPDAAPASQQQQRPSLSIVDGSSSSDDDGFNDDDDKDHWPKAS